MIFASTQFRSAFAELPQKKRFREPSASGPQVLPSCPARKYFRVYLQSHNRTKKKLLKTKVMPQRLVKPGVVRGARHEIRGLSQIAEQATQRKPRTRFRVWTLKCTTRLLLRAAQKHNNPSRTFWGIRVPRRRAAAQPMLERHVS